jgi:DNA-binding MarR family transcriptional regulator
MSNVRRVSHSSAASPDQSNADVAEAITMSLLRVINKIEQGRRTPRDYGSGVSMTLLEAEMCALIAQHPGITGSELSEELSVTRSATSQTISKLRAKNLVSEIPSHNDAKRKQLHLSNKGEQAAAIAEQFKAQMAEQLFRESREELESYLRFVTKLESFHSQVIGQSEQNATQHGGQHG